MREALTADQAVEQDDQFVTEEDGQAIIEQVKESFNETENATVDESLEVKEEICVESTEEVVKAKLERNKVIQKVIVNSVTKPV